MASRAGRCRRSIRKRSTPKARCSSRARLSPTTSPRARSCCGVRTTCLAGSPGVSLMYGSTGLSRSARPPMRTAISRTGRPRARCCSFHRHETRRQGDTEPVSVSPCLLVSCLSRLVRFDHDIHKRLLVAPQVVVALVEGAKQLDAGIDRVEQASAVALTTEAIGRVAQPLRQQVVLDQRLADAVDDEVDERKRVVGLLLQLIDREAG